MMGRMVSWAAHAASNTGRDSFSEAASYITRHHVKQRTRRGAALSLPLSYESRPYSWLNAQSGEIVPLVLPSLVPCGPFLRARSFTLLSVASRFRGFGCVLGAAPRADLREALNGFILNAIRRSLASGVGRLLAGLGREFRLLVTDTLDLSIRSQPRKLSPGSTLVATSASYERLSSIQGLSVAGGSSMLRATLSSAICSKSVSVAPRPPSFG